jgi:hypothetical protein
VTWSLELHQRNNGAALNCTKKLKTVCLIQQATMSSRRLPDGRVPRIEDPAMVVRLFVRKVPVVELHPGHGLLTEAQAQIAMDPASPAVAQAVPGVVCTKVAGNAKESDKSTTRLASFIAQVLRDNTIRTGSSTDLKPPDLGRVPDPAIASTGLHVPPLPITAICMNAVGSKASTAMVKVSCTDAILLK